ncbi:hypothetical protein VNO80_13324 [Phaseolus coccineus]|uniref:UDP-glucose:glycoprotein glucosyltransferase thioredoxin-like domain-containing protein n=1 Tax=Phaseolus coccineus TaxID=3886 RepID=A0AAN9N1E8_PHACN
MLLAAIDENHRVESTWDDFFNEGTIRIGSKNKIFGLGSHTCLTRWLLVLRNGVIYTNEDSLPFAESMAVANGRVLRAGNHSFVKVGIFLHRLLGSESDVNAVFTNGRIRKDKIILVTYPIDESTYFSTALLLLESIEFKQRTKHILEIIEEVKWQHVDPGMLTSKFISDIVMAVSSSMAVRERSSESARFEILNDQHR